MPASNQQTLKQGSGHKVWRQLNREGFEVGRDRVRRLMRRLQLAGVRRGK